nr:MAG TPA: hypothetical protein [Caudoviricetes sp.]
MFHALLTMNNYVRNGYKQSYKVSVIKWLHKFFININRQFEIITKIMFHAGLHYINRHKI